MRKKKHPEHVNHERWLISYADFITLLFAFFVVMFAVSQVDTNKMGRFTESFSKAVGLEMFPNGGKGLLPATGSMLEIASEAEVSEGELGEVRDALKKLAESNEALKSLEMTKYDHELVLRLPTNVIFPSGEDGVQTSANAALVAIADQVRSRDVDVRVEGHTDNRPISTSRFRSNWDLSACRATAILAVLAKEGTIPPSRLSAVGYGEFHPVATNDTPEGRGKNRRVELVLKLIPKVAAIPPAPTASSAAPAPSASASAPAASANPGHTTSDHAPEVPKHAENHQP